MCMCIGRSAWFVIDQSVGIGMIVIMLFIRTSRVVGSYILRHSHTYNDTAQSYI
jgi:hypothetical protein